MCNKMFCNKCGCEVKNNSTFCSKCGNKIVSNIVNESTHSAYVKDSRKFTILFSKNLFI